MDANTPTAAQKVSQSNARASTSYGMEKYTLDTMRDEMSDALNATRRAVHVGTGKNKVNDLTNPLSWTLAFSCFLAGLIFIFFTSAYLIYFYLGRLYPDVYLEVNQDYWVWTFPTLAVADVLLIALSYHAYTLRNHTSKDTYLLYAFLVLCSWIIIFSSYFLGIFTNLYPSVSILSSWIIGLLLFPLKPMKVVFITVTVSVLVTLYLIDQNIIPYAPFYNLAYTGANHTPSRMLNAMNITTLVLFLGSCWVTQQVIELWKRKEQNIKRTTIELRRANNAISRYLGQEVHDALESEFGDYYSHSQRRQLTMCCVDIDGFAELADTLLPEDISILLNSYWIEMTSIAKRYQTTIESAMGDTIMIFFGAPEDMTVKKQALLAIEMGLEMQGKMGLLRRQWSELDIPHRLHIRIGINTGLASLSAHGIDSNHLSYTALGQQMDVAANLQVECIPDHIYISESTLEHVKDEVECVLKGSMNGAQGELIRFYDVIRFHSHQS